MPGLVENFTPCPFPPSSVSVVVQFCYRRRQCSPQNALFSLFSSPVRFVVCFCNVATPPCDSRFFVVVFFFVHVTKFFLWIVFEFGLRSSRPPLDLGASMLPFPCATLARCLLFSPFLLFCHDCKRANLRRTVPPPPRFHYDCPTLVS